MAAKVADNMSEFGSVLLVGAAIDDAKIIALDTYIGPREGQGPLGALVDALQNSKEDLLLVSPCDTPFFEKQDFSRLVEAMVPDFDVAVARDDRNHWLLSCWRIPTSTQHLEQQFSNGERAIHRAVVGWRIVEVPFLVGKTRNINTQADLSK